MIYEGQALLPRGTATIAPRFPLLKSYSFFIGQASNRDLGRRVCRMIA
jgi:hypothetical protein